MSRPKTDARKLLSEPEAWREIGRFGVTLMYAALDGLCAPDVEEAALRRLRSYDDPAWKYDEDDHFANLTPDDATIAAEWLALEAEDEALR